MKRAPVKKWAPDSSETQNIPIAERCYDPRHEHYCNQCYACDAGCDKRYYGEAGRLLRGMERVVGV